MRLKHQRDRAPLMRLINMKKTEIYIQMFNLVIPYVRSIQSQNAWVKARDMSCYFEAGLIHNLPKRLI